jgi:uncharacterized membrane protein
MIADSAISRLSYAGARSSNAEAMMDIARRHNDVTDARDAGKSEDAIVAQLGDDTRSARSEHHLDKRA